MPKNNYDVCIVGTGAALAYYLWCGICISSCGASLVLILLIHIAAAFYHQFIMQDKLLRRMRLKRFD